jgi:Domain of Unknown Function (DUF928)
MSIDRSLKMLLFLAILFGSAQISRADSFDPPPGQGEPGSTAGGASRPIKSSCLVHPEKTDSLTPLSPKTYLGLTAQARPTFWVYVPETPAQTLEFSLFDRQRKGIYQTRIKISNTASGLVQIPLPETAPELTPNQSYAWTVALVCNPKRRTEDWVANGWIQRQPLNVQLQKHLKQTKTDLERVKLYHQSQFWYDAIALLIQPAQTSSAASNQAWTETVKAAGLNQIADPRIKKTAHR